MHLQLNNIKDPSYKASPRSSVVVGVPGELCGLLGLLLFGRRLLARLLDEAAEPPVELERTSMHRAVAPSAPQADVGADARDLPLVRRRTGAAS